MKLGVRPRGRRHLRLPLSGSVRARRVGPRDERGRRRAPGRAGTLLYPASAYDSLLWSAVATPACRDPATWRCFSCAPSSRLPRARACPRPWIEERAAQRKREPEREPSAHEPDEVDQDQGHAPDAHAIEQPDQVSADVAREEAGGHFARPPAPAQLMRLEQYRHGSGYAVPGRSRAE
jgi:hypothetical protein